MSIHSCINYTGCEKTRAKGSAFCPEHAKVQAKSTYPAFLKALMSIKKK